MKQTVYHNRVERVVFELNQDDLKEASLHYLASKELIQQPPGSTSTVHFNIWDGGDETTNIRAQVIINYTYEDSKREANLE
jgi:hypothetical protein